MCVPSMGAMEMGCKSPVGKPKHENERDSHLKPTAEGRPTVGRSRSEAPTAAGNHVGAQGRASACFLTRACPASERNRRVQCTAAIAASHQCEAKPHGRSQARTHGGVGPVGGSMSQSRGSDSASSFIIDPIGLRATIAIIILESYVIMIPVLLRAEIGNS